MNGATRYRGAYAALLALLLTLAFFGFMGALFVLAVPEGNKDMLMMAAGVLFGGANLAWGFYFGSSTGSKTKEETMVDQGPPTEPRL